MADTRAAYAIAIQLYQDLHNRQDSIPELSHAVDLADQLARELGWAWVNEDK